MPTGTSITCRRLLSLAAVRYTRTVVMPASTGCGTAVKWMPAPSGTLI